MLLHTLRVPQTGFPANWENQEKWENGVPVRRKPGQMTKNSKSGENQDYLWISKVWVCPK